MDLTICETFVSLLGESTLAGLPAFFIRLTGCNLRCRYCDTTHAYDGGESRPVDSLVEQARGYATRLVLVTGGEPLLQTGTSALLGGLIEDGLGGHNLWANLEVLTPRDEVKFVIDDEDDFTWALDVAQRYRLTGRVPVLISPVFGALSLPEVAAWLWNRGHPVRP